jgi:hypothetical protein
MSKVTVIIELVDNKQLNISGPLEHDRELCIRMIKEALKVSQSYKGSSLVIADQVKFAELSKEHINHQIRQKL